MCFGVTAKATAKALRRSLFRDHKKPPLPRFQRAQLPGPTVASAADDMRAAIALHVAGWSPDTVGGSNPTRCTSAGEVRDATDSDVPMHPARSVTTGNKSPAGAGVGGVKRLRQDYGPQHFVLYGSFVPAFPVYGLTFGLLDQLSNLVAFGAV